MSDDIKKGLLGIVVDETEVSKVMPEINSLTYRGYAAQDLCEYCRFEEVAYLILNKDLPNTIQLRKFEKEEKNNRELSKDLYSVIKKMPKKSHPMDVARTAVSIMGLEDKETTDSSPEANMRKAIRILAKTPTALAAFYRIRKGKKIIKPKKNLNIAENFFYMCFGKVPQKEIVKAFDVSLILIHGAITGAIASLKGPLHGGANEEVMHMMNKIKDPKNALKWINDALDNKEVVMGFGHRVYKSGDSRVPTMRKYFSKVAKIKKDKKFEKIYDIVEKVMIERKNIHPNVDYPTGPTYHLMGFDTDFFTPIFVVSRITGWSAHIMEQHAANKLIRPLASYKGTQLHDPQRSSCVQLRLTLYLTIQVDFFVHRKLVPILVELVFYYQ